MFCYYLQKVRIINVVLNFSGYVLSRYCLK